MNTIWVTTNGRPSNGAKALANQPGFKRAIKGKAIKKGDGLVNWGSSQILEVHPDIVIRRFNTHNSVNVACNKLTFFNFIEDKENVRVVPWTTDKEVVGKWQAAGHTVVARTVLTGHSGDGIIIVGPDDPIPDAPLYTKYIFKTKEFRVHVVGGKVIDTQRKIRDPNKEVKNWKIRSHANGFIYTRNGIEHDDNRDDCAIAAVDALGLDFGAVDIILDKSGLYYVLEINTAPGLEGQTVERYAAAFRSYWES
jgi:hypothetical protein